MPINLSRYHTFALPAYADHCVRLTRLDQLAELQSKHSSLFFLGEGSNTVFLSDPADTTVVLVRLYGKKIIREDAHHVWIRARAGESWNRFAWKCASMNWWGTENLVDIPGLIGAAPIQNIGAYGAEIASLIESIEWLDVRTHRMHHFKQNECQFGYRHSFFKTLPPNSFLITAVTFRLNKHAAPSLHYPDLKALHDTPNNDLTPIKIAQSVSAIRTQKLPNPAMIGNAGSFFKNPMVAIEHAQSLMARHPQLPRYPAQERRQKLSAAWLIEHAGLKGFHIGRVAVSSQHALVLTHRKKPPYRLERERQQTLADMRQLIATTQAQVFHHFNVALDTEPTIFDGQ